MRGCCGPQSDYAVSVARSKKLEGPYEKYQGNPILHGSKEVLSIGHGTITTTPDGRMYYLCHAYQPGSGFYQGRQPYLQEVRMGEDHWPHFVTGEYASRTQPMPFAESAQVPVFDFSDDFTVLPCVLNGVGTILTLMSRLKSRTVNSLYPEPRSPA